MKTHCSINRFYRAAFAVLFLFLFLPSSVLAEQRTQNLYWAPENVTVGGEEIDRILNVIFFLTAAVFVLVTSVYIYFLVKYRRRPGIKAHYTHGNNTLEIIWTAIPTVIFLWLAFWSNDVWFHLHREPPEDSLKVDIVSYQFGWDMRYAGQDGVLGSIDEEEGFTFENKFAKKSSDASGLDDFESTELVLPANRPVHVYLRSRDVIHSFYVPEFRLYQDAVPGRTIGWVWFEVTRPGEFELACSQLCGTGHYNMKARIRVLPPEDFDKWYAERSAAALTAAKESTPSLETSALATTPVSTEAINPSLQ